MNRLLAVTIVLLALTGCSKNEPAEAPEPPAGQAFEILAGGGTTARADRALDTKLSGVVKDLEIAPDGTAYLLIAEGGTTRLDRIRPDGSHTTINLLDARDVGSQIAIGPDGSVYVNLYWGDKKRTPSTGSGRTAPGNR